MNIRTVGCAAVAVLCASSQAATAALRPVSGDLSVVEHKSVVVYKSTPQGDLKINLYFPADWKPGDHRAGIVFFFGGGFVSGNPSQFTSKAEYLATRGMVAASAEYRIKNVHHTMPEKSIEDAKSAVRWMRMNAARLGIDPGRIIAGGGSAGGTCAAFTAYNTTYEPEGEDKSVSSVPNALVLYNPALGFTAKNIILTPQEVQQQKEIGPFLTAWKVTKGGPPAILFFGSKDRLGEPARGFTKKLLAAGIGAEYYLAPDQGHGFFNDRGGTPWHALTLRQTDIFLTSLGYLSGPPSVPIPPGTTVALERWVP
jgi:acetyl esterase